MRKTFTSLLTCIIILLCTEMKSQTFLIGVSTPNGVFLYTLDVSTCTSCAVMPNIISQALTPLPSGELLNIFQTGSGTNLNLYTPPSNVPTQTNVLNGIFATDIFYDPSGTIYLVATDGLYTYDYVNNTATFVGSWPVGYNIFDVQYVGGVYYGRATDPITNECIYFLVNINDPAQSTILHNNMPVEACNTPGFSFAVNGNSPGVYFVSAPPFASEGLYQYDPASNSSNFVCNIPTGTFTLYAEIPPGFSLPCLCSTDAGSVTPGLQEICLTDDAVVPFNNDDQLESDDLLQYILFSDPADTLGSILVTSNTANIPFDPNIMQAGVTYYLATIAGNDLNGNVDLTDDCLDISNASEVVWQPPPTVSFSVADPDICAGGCIDLNVELTGSPPFALEGELLSGNVVVGTFSESFMQNNGTVEICAPTGVSPGSLEVQATLVADGNCTCQ